MAISKNNAIQKNHFRKDWQRRVRVHLDQAGKKHSRRVARAAAAKLVAPRPLEALRPIVRAPTLKYNRKVRAGRGFSLEEIKAAGLNKRYARTVGIAVDHRRQNRSVEGLEANVARLKEYLSKLVVFKASKEAKGVAQVSTEAVFPIASASKEIEVKAVNADAPSAYRTLRDARSLAKYKGIREKRAKDKAEAEAEKKK